MPFPVARAGARGRARPVVAPLFVALVLALPGAVLTGEAGATSPATQTTVQSAIAWLVAHQQADGGFELAGSAGFETPDAVLAIASAAQTGPAWSTSEALAAVEAVKTGAGLTPLDALDDWADASVPPAEKPGRAAKLLALAVLPLGLDPTDFDPSNDSPSPVDLVTDLDPSGCAGNPSGYGFFNETLLGVIAKRILCGSVAPGATAVATIRAGQQADGAWNFAGDPTGTDIDPDTTGLAIQALVVAGAAWDDPSVKAGLGFLADHQGADGSYTPVLSGFAGNPNVNSTALAVLGIAAAGFDPTSSCWRDSVRPAMLGTAYGDPDGWVRSQQDLVDGHLKSPYDQAFGVNSFATTQGIEGLLRRWLPVVVATGAPTCSPAPVPEEPPPAEPVVLAPVFTG